MSAEVRKIPLPDEDATRQLAVAVAGILRAGDVILLEGSIGTGKTFFARNVIQTILGMRCCYHFPSAMMFTKSPYPPTAIGKQGGPRWMSDRISTFLTRTHAKGWSQQPLAGDASTRLYVRLTSQMGETAILMDAAIAAPEDMQKFALIDEALRDAGLCAPQIYDVDHASGLMLLEDFGQTDIAKAVQRNPELATSCYDAATDILLNIQRVMPLPLPVLDAESAALWLAPLGEWYDAEPRDISSIQAALVETFDALDMKPDTLALRDYHAENLMWRPDRNGLERIGLLDFQDAFYAPAGYDLASLTRDARRDVDAENLRILGIFARLAKQQGKPEYAAFAPRVWAYLTNDLAHPMLAKLRLSPQDAARAWARLATPFRNALSTLPVAHFWIMHWR